MSMTSSSVSIGAIAFGVVLAIVVIAAAIVIMLIAIGFRRMQGQQQEIHELVNTRMDNALTRISQLISALESQGIAVPSDPNPSDPQGRM
jgi:acid phosphatase family membrane protein YuiD